jgi:carboxyl-terminal processing protease
LKTGKNFILSEQQYQEFVQWMKGKDYSYQSIFQDGAEALQSAAKKEKYYTEIKPQLEAIQAKLKESRKNDLFFFKDQIKMLLEEEIIARYYFEKGTIEVRFKRDSQLKKAVEVLGDPLAYKKILNTK